MLITAFVPSLMASGLLANQARLLAGRADTANRVELEVDTAVALGATLDTIEGERGLSSGLVSLRVLGLTESEVNEIIGYDLRPELATLRSELDVELATIDRSLLSADIAGLLDQLATIRARIDEGTLGPGGIDAYYQDLSRLVNDQAQRNLQLGSTQLGELGAPELISSLQTIKTLNDVSLGGARWVAQAYLHNFLPSDVGGLALVVQSEVLGDNIAELEKENPDLRSIPEWAAIADGADRDRYTSHLLDELSGESLEEGAHDIELLNEIGPRERQRADDLREVSEQVMAQISGELAQISHRATVYGYGAAAVALTLLLLLLWMTTRSIRVMSKSVGGLHQRAELISAGRLETGTLFDDRAPAEAAAVHHSLDQLVAILQRLRAQAQALADGEFDAPVLDESAQGPIGAAFAGSIERLRRTTADLRDSEQMARTVIDTASESILVVDHKGDIIQANRAAIAGLGQASLSDRGAASIIADWRSLIGGSSEVVIEAIDGSHVQALVSGSSFETDRGAVTILIWRDITARKDAENQLRYLAHHDSLTDLLNRSGMRLELASREDQGEPTSVVYLDLDRFKPLNDLYGHDMGDFALTEVARRLSLQIRPGDLVARVGGDEFVVITGAINEAAGRLADRLVEAVREPLALPNGAHYQIGLSAGWASGPDVGSAELLRRADVALYASKACEGGSVVAFDETIARLDADRRRTEVELADAIGRGELVLYGQPIVTLDTGETVGIESLVRWNHPERGLLTPASFIPIAERTDLILDVDRWVLGAGIAFAAAHPQLPRISINISGRFLRRDDFVGFVAMQLQRHSLDPARLQIEITETHQGIDSTVAAESAVLLHRLGVRIALDDFGTGFSSLTHLLRMPINAIKIDRSMVSRIAEDEARSVVQAIIGYGRMQGLDVIAEGIETATQADLLRQSGCLLGQGYRFSVPRPLESFVPGASEIAPLGHASMTASASERSMNPASTTSATPSSLTLRT